MIATNPFLRKIRRGVRLLQRCAFFLLPPAFFNPLRLLLPRIFQRDVQRQFLQAVKRRVPSKIVQAITWRPRRRPGELLDVGLFAAAYCDAYWLPERSPANMALKANDYRRLLETRLDRARLSGEIARLERHAGNDLVAALYAIRSMRLCGDDAAGNLAWVNTALRKHGYHHEAEAVDVMFGPRAERFERCLQLIQAATERGRTTAPRCDFVAHEDERGQVRPRVSIIVSLYNAAAKLPVFVQALRGQTLMHRGQLEVIFVDSASPADEHRAVRECRLAGEFPYLYVRTPERESIQTAWNRGIELARAPYLAFLGVDETVFPTAYEELAAELDAHAETDWVMADSLIIEVDGNGVPGQDVWAYDRHGYHQDLVYLETCYLSWVGGLYRKSIHDRFGYYDGSFRAAGDTEFKSRVLPFIRTSHLPKLLGLFLNYPEERTTASPRAELEDLRAWYLHRTPAGVEYAFGKRDVGDLETMLARSLNYRKSYCPHLSTDVEYACSVAQVLRRRSPKSQALPLADGATRMLAAYRTLDQLPGATAAKIEQSLRSAIDVLADVQREHRQTGLLPDAAYNIFQDNRYEQHTNLW